MTGKIRVDMGDGEWLCVRIVACDEPLASALLALAHDGAAVEVGGVIRVTAADYEKAGATHPTLGMVAYAVKFELECAERGTDTVSAARAHRAERLNG
ncbi:MAG: hypothetical protein WCB10_15200 [Steroidobacteraceae bacterium]